MTAISILDLLKLDSLNLSCICGRSGLDRKLYASKISRPGLPLSGFFESFSDKSVQVFGQGEQVFLASLEREGNFENIKKFFSFTLPCCVFTDSGTPGKAFIEIAESSGCAVLQTPLISSDFSRMLYQLLDEEFAPTQVIHGVMMEVFGVGVLLTGESGVGKSETALELLERGHRLISDDVVRLRNINGQFLMASGVNKKLAHNMEIRGLGILNVAELYGIGAIREKKQVQLWAELEVWDPEKEYMRISPETKGSILGVNVPKFLIPVKPGRNIPILVETAARLFRLRKLGFATETEYEKEVSALLGTKMIESESL